MKVKLKYHHQYQICRNTKLSQFPYLGFDTIEINLVLQAMKGPEY